MAKGIRFVPLKASFMLASIIGLIVSILFIGNLNKTWSFAFALVFALMFIASLLSTARTKKV